MEAQEDRKLKNYCSRLKEVLNEVGKLTENDIEYCMLLTIEEFKKPLHEQRTYFLHAKRGDREITISGGSPEICRQKRGSLYPDWEEISIV